MTGMMKTLLAAFAIALLTAPASGQSSLDRLDDWSEARGWEGVGLLMIAGQTTCTGALIRPDLVLTAAHCLWDDARKGPVEPRLAEFCAAWRDGRAISNRVGKRVLLHPDYVRSPRVTGAQIYNDVALLQLDTPVSGATARPFATGAGDNDDISVSVVSYGAGRNDAASIERACEVIEAHDGIVAFSCSVVPGSSGAPVFADRGGRAHIISLISALGPDGTAYGMDLSEHLDQMLADFDAGRGVYPTPVQGNRRISVTGGTSTSSGGALFLKP